MEDINARARLLAVEVLLAEPELLGNDALEADLYILRDKLRAGATTTDAHNDATAPQGPETVDPDADAPGGRPGRRDGLFP